MKIKLDPPFTLFIGDIRKLDKEAQERKIRSEIRRIASAKTNNVLEQYTNVLKLVYFGIHGYDVDEMVFIKAAESNDACVKQIGYLGLSIIKDKSLLILTVNTVMKDLRHSYSRRYALNFLGNLDNGQIYSELSSLISANTNNDTNAVKSIVAKNVLSNMQRFSIVGNDESLLYTKVQIILEKLTSNVEFSLSENEILFFISLYMCTKSRFLKVKLVQLYTYFQQEGLLNVSRNFYKTLEGDIIQPHEKIKPYVDIGLSIVISDFLLMCNYTNPRIESFVYRLIESQNFNSIYQGFNISSKHKLFVDTTINKAIKIGIHRPAAFNALISLINKTNYLTVYKRKDEMRFYMDKQNVPYEKSDSILTRVACKVLSYANDSIYTKIWFENPDLAFFEPFDKNIEREKVEILFSKLWYMNDINYFYLMYLLLPLKTLNVENMVKLFRAHLHYLIKLCIYQKKAESNKFSQDLLELETSDSSIENYDIIICNKVAESENIEADFKNTSTFEKIPQFSKQAEDQGYVCSENLQINDVSAIENTRGTPVNNEEEHRCNEGYKLGNMKLNHEDSSIQNAKEIYYRTRKDKCVDTCSFGVNQDFSQLSSFIVKKRYILLNKLLSVYLLSSETDGYCEILANSIDDFEIDIDKELKNVLVNFLLLFSSNSEISYIIFGDKNIFRYKVTKNRLEIFHSNKAEKIEIESPESSSLSFFRSMNSIECDVSGMPYVKVYVRYNSVLFEKFIYLH